MEQNKLITIDKQSVPAGTPAIKLGNKVFPLFRDNSFYKCASVDTSNKTWTGYKAVLENGFYTITDEQKTLEYGSFIPEVGKVYPKEMTGIFTPFKDPSLLPVINDPNTVFLIYPVASEGRIENIGMGKDACTGDFTCDMTVEDNKLKSGGKLTLPAGYLPVNALNPASEWTLDIWFDLDLENLGEGTKAVLSSNDYSSSDMWVVSGEDGSFEFRGIQPGPGPVLTLSTLEYPVTPRRITLEQWSDNGTMQISVYIDGKCIYSAAKTVNGKFIDYGVVFPGRQNLDSWFSGHYAMISVRTVADHRGQSFEIKNNPYS